MTVDAHTIDALTHAVQRGIAAVTDAERALEQSLQRQENALSVGDAEGIVLLNAELDQQLVHLRAAGEELRADVDDLSFELGLRHGTPIAEVLRAHPNPRFAAELSAAQNVLIRLRRAVRGASTKNGTIARASLDAITSVRGVLSRAVAGDIPAAMTSLSRLDAEA